MKLLDLVIRNFKGIKTFVLNAQGENVSLWGDNATGKTTVFDSVMWLLFDKDSENKKDFAIKTLDADNKVIHNLEHEVEGIFEINGKKITLCKVYYENWTQKRGSATKTFSGHTTDYFIDGVPVKKTEYAARITEIASEDIFKLLTNPSYFNTQLHWEQRRKIILEVCGDLTDQEVIASDKKLAKLPEILDGRSLDDHKKVINSRRSKINEELKKIPIRIDEITRALPDISEIKPNEIQSKITQKRAEINEKQAEIARINNGGEIAEKQKKLAQVEADLIRLRSEASSGYDVEISEKRKQVYKLQEEIAEYSGDIRTFERDIRNAVEKVGLIGAELETLRLLWTSVDSEEFKFEQDDTCPTCGQHLPQEQLEEARRKAEESFNLAKAKKLEEISAQGKRKKQEQDDYQRQIHAAEDQMPIVQKALDVKLKIQDKLHEEIKQLQSYVQAPIESLAFKTKAKEKQMLEQEIDKLGFGNHASISKAREEILEIQYEIDTAGQELAKINHFKSSKARIEELMAEEKLLATEYEKLESELYLVDEFTKSKVRLLEEKINSKFKFARFKLFNILVNGGVEECCTALYEGVPYDAGLNNGHRGIVGLDIIATLADHYNFYPPIFYDNAESVTKLPEMKSQMICLYVSEKDKTLRIEKGEKYGNCESLC